MGLPAYSDGEFIDFPRSTFLGADWGNVHFPISDYEVSLKHDFSNGWEAKGTFHYRDSDFKGKYASAFPIRVAPSASTALFILYNGDFDHNDFGGDVNISGPIKLFGQEHTVLFGYNRAWFQRRGGNRNTVLGCVDKFCLHDVRSISGEPSCGNDELLSMFG